MPTRAGRLDTPIKLLQSSVVRDSDGAEREVWLTVAEPMATWESKAGSDQFIADQRSPRQPVICTIRYRRDVTPKHRVERDGQVYEIADVGRPDRNITLVLTLYAFDAGV